MLAASPARLARRILPALLLGFYGCSDPSAPVSPRIDTRLHALTTPAITVLNTDSDGPGSLHQAIVDAATGALIQFAPSLAGKTIVVSSNALLRVQLKTVTIEGPLPGGITISGGLQIPVFDVDRGNLTLRNLSVVDGRYSDGGGIIVATGRLTLDHVLLANNEAAGNGGGIGAFNDSHVIIVNSTISGNVAPERGGAIYSEGELTIRNSTIANNTSLSGAVAVDEGSVSIRNTILGNLQTGGNCDFSQGIGTTFIGTNLSDDVSCGSNGVTLGNALLKPLANNGGPSRTHAIDVTSVAVDAGTLCTESTDQRYVARPAGASCDVGAFEFNDYGTFNFAIDPNITVNSGTRVATVTGTVTCPRPAAATVLVTLQQTQKITGKFTTIINGSTAIGITCGTSRTSWSAPITPLSGDFEKGAASASLTTTTFEAGFLPGNAAATVKLFNAK
jgi:predicted outer membrane repeat protein